MSKAPSPKEAIRRVMIVLENYPSGGVGEDGPTLPEMEAFWNEGGVYEDGRYDTCQHAWLLLDDLLKQRRT